MMMEAPERYMTPYWEDFLADLGLEPTASVGPSLSEADVAGDASSKVDRLSVEVPDRATTGHREGTILIVEDEPLVREAMRELLVEDELNVVGECSNGADGVRAAMKLRPDVILMDLRMPGMGGIEATAQIMRYLPASQVIVLTAYDDPALRTDAIEAGAYCFIPKGSSAQLILQTVRAALRMAMGLRAEG